MAATIATHGLLATAAREGVLPSDLRHPSRYRSIVEPYRRRNARFLCSQAPADPVSKNPPRKAPASRLSQAPQDATSTRRKACLSARPRTARLSFRPLHPRLRGRVHLAHGPGRATFSWRRNPPPRPATGHVHLAHGGRSASFSRRDTPPPQPQHVTECRAVPYHKLARACYPPRWYLDT